MSIAEKLVTVAENVPKVYEAGKKAEYDAFWDTFQQNGTRRRYSLAFTNSGRAWNSTNFKPKYDIICEGDASYCFYAWENLSAKVDVGGILKAQGVTLDTSKATSLNDFFAYGKSIVGELPVISLESAGANTREMFRGVLATKIEKLIVTEQTNFSNMFLYCSNLAEIEFEGTIATGELNMSSCKNLSAASLKSIIDALSLTTTGLTVTLPTTAQTTYDAANGDGAWAQLVATKANWTVAYA